MKLWTCIDHESVWVGGASIVIANDETQARELFDIALRKVNLHPEDGYTLVSVDLNTPQAIILRDGDY